MAQLVMTVENWQFNKKNERVVVVVHVVVRHVRKTRTFFSKYADRVIAKYAAEIGRDCIFA